MNMVASGRADTYYGKRATNYDLDRCHSLRWANEQRAVADMVFSGPVLDVPVGTGRYVEIYRSKGLDVVGVDISEDMLAESKRKYPDLDARKGSIFALPFADKTFGTVVCTRLLDWLSPIDMLRAVAELRRMANIIVVTIRHGPEECRTNWTHDLAKFYQAISGLFICERRTTEITRDGREEIFRLRPPEWKDVVRQFQYHGHTPEHEMDRLAGDWVGHINLRQSTAVVSSEYWSDHALGAVLDVMAAQHDYGKPKHSRYITDLRPRYEADAVTILYDKGRHVILDGRRRINQWRKMPGRYPVLVVRRK